MTARGFRIKNSMKLVYQYMAIFFNFSPTLNHLHPLQAENCDSNSRLVVDEDENGKLRLERVNYHSYIVFITYLLYFFVINIDLIIHISMHTAMLSQMNISHITYRIREEGDTVSVQCSNSPLLAKNSVIQLFNEHWYLSVKNTEVHDVVVVGTDVNLLILLSKRSHHSNT